VAGRASLLGMRALSILTCKAVAAPVDRRGGNDPFTIRRPVDVPPRQKPAAELRDAQIINRA
jgi:hypothetical protein